MEAMWTRFFPAIIQLRKWLTAGYIGKVLALEADFGIHFKVGPEHRIFNPDLGGGALLDLGIYPISFASMVYGAQPKKIVSTVHKAKTGVDNHAVITFEYADSATAALTTSSRVRIRHEARIFGTKGMITVHEGFLSSEPIDTGSWKAKNQKPSICPIPAAECSLKPNMCTKPCATENGKAK